MSVEQNALESYVVATANAIGLPIPAASLPLVVENVERLLAAGTFVLQLPLPDDLEPASIFQP